MQQFPTFTGIDISKLTLDICLIHNNIKQHYKIDNTIASIKSFFSLWNLLICILAWKIQVATIIIYMKY